MSDETYDAANRAYHRGMREGKEIALRMFLDMILDAKKKAKNPHIVAAHHQLAHRLRSAHAETLKILSEAEENADNSRT